MGETYEIYDGETPIERFEVRDSRAQTRFFIDNAFYDEFVPVFGSSLSMVYVALVRHANKSQKTWPSQSRLATQLGLSRKWVGIQLQILECFNLIRTVRLGKTCTNRYYLVDEKQWRRDPEQLAQELVSMAIAEKFPLQKDLTDGLRTQFSSLKFAVMGTEYPSVMRTPVGKVANRTSLKMALEFASNSKVKQSKVSGRTTVKKVQKETKPKQSSSKFEYEFDPDRGVMIEKPQRPKSKILQ